MWDKPRQLSGYPDNGYEIEGQNVGAVSAATALKAWAASPGHTAVILSQAPWNQVPWKVG